MSKKPTLLCVDDEERILKTLKILFKLKYNVITTTNGHEAIEIARKEKIHAIISDQRMPEIAGVDVLRQVKKVAPNTMRILLTGYSDLTAIVGSVNDGEIFRYINKPWDKDELRNTVEQAVKIATDLDDVPNREGVKIESKQGLGILVVDKDVQTFETVKTLVAEDCNVKWSSSLDHAFETLSNDKSIAVLISEVKVGDEDISQPLKILKQYHPQLLTVVITSFKDTKVLISLINQGQIYKFLPKPINNKLLERSIKETIWHYHFLQKVPKVMKRHSVEKPKETQTRSIPAKIFGYLKNMRGS